MSVVVITGNEELFGTVLYFKDGPRLLGAAHLYFKGAFRLVGVLR